MAATSVLRFLITLCLFFQVINANPTGCIEKVGNYDAVIPTQCTWGSFTSPLTHSTFTTFSWQRLELLEWTGSISNSQFSGFSGASTASFDSNFAQSILLYCKSGQTSFTMSSNAFSQFPSVQTITIRNCHITTFQANVFTNLNLDHLIFEGGKMATLDADSFASLTINKMNITADDSGLIIQDCPITTLPEGVFDSLSTMERLVLEGTNLDYVSARHLQNLTNLRYISFGNNQMTNLTRGMFDHLRGLSYLHLEGNIWSCTCDNLWILDYSVENDIDLVGGPICDTPSTYNYKRATTYYNDVCPKEDACGDMIGLVIGPNTCLPIYKLVCYILLVIIIIIACISLALICKVRSDLRAIQQRLKNRRASSWNRVQQAMKKKDTKGQKPKLGEREGSQASFTSMTKQGWT